MTLTKKNKLTTNESGDSSPEAGLFFLDSGAHSLYTREVIKTKHKKGYAFYETQEFWDYVDAYAAFVKKYKKYIDYYANVDVIFNPEMSWKVQKYLENEHGLRPVPVIHYGTPLKWLTKHLETGYDLIGLGGLGQEATAGLYRKWADSVFTELCPKPHHLPVVRTHGFAMTAYRLLIRYPWWSVDSATWTKVGAFGGIMLPHKRQGKFTFEEEPYNICMSQDSPAVKINGKHYKTLSRPERAIVAEWLELIGVPMGKTAPDGEIIEYGVMNRHSERKIANLLFFERLRAWLPPYPWPFKHTENRKKGFGLC